MDKQTALAQLKTSRDTFWVSLAGYALLTQKAALDILSSYRVEVYNDDLKVIEKTKPKVPRQGTSYEMQYKSVVDHHAAKQVVDRSLRHMLVEAFEAASEYAESAGLKHELKQQDWFWFTFHLRNAFAHGGKWKFKANAKKHLPARWRQLTIDTRLEGQSIEGFIGWSDGLQLRATITIFVSES